MISPSLSLITRGYLQSSDGPTVEEISTIGRVAGAFTGANSVTQNFTFYSRVYTTLTFTINIGYYEPYRQPPLGDR